MLGDLTYQYDAAGNRIGIGGSFARTLLPDPVSSATYDAAGRQLTFGDTTTTYDANGNLTSITDPSGVTTFTWNARNRLIAVTGPGVTASFTYDPLGRRVAKEVNGQLTEYFYDGDDIIEELTDGTSTTYLRSSNIDEPWVRTTGSLQEFYLADPLGSIVRLTDPAGTLTTGYSYEPFGGTAMFGPPSPQTLGFTGREDDQVAGLYYYRARYYSPRLHRFISEDPARTQGNGYAYAGNRPVIATDPLGLFTLVVRGGFGTGPTGLSGSGQGGMQQITTRLRGIPEEVSVRGPDETAAILADLRGNQGDKTGVNVVCHSRGCDQILSELAQNAAVHVDRLVTLDCYGGFSCGTIPDNVDVNLNYWQPNGPLHGGPNQRGDGSLSGITNIQRSESHSRLPGSEDVQAGIENCVGYGQCGARGGRKD